MSFNYFEIIRSTPFEFVIGPDCETFTIHTALAAHHSSVLAVMMSKAEGESITLNDVDRETFGRFCQYAYAKDYAPAPHMIDSTMVDEDSVVPNGEQLDSSPSTPTEEPLLNNSFLEWRMSRMNQNKSKKGAVNERHCVYCGHKPGKKILWNEFRNTLSSFPIARFEARRNLEEYEDYTSVFLSHARVYYFAEKYNVAELRTLALDKLYQTLDVFNIYTNRVGDIINLVRYTYSDIHNRDKDGVQDVDSLRTLVIHYVAYMFENFAKDKGFLALMEEGGLFVRDLTAMLLRRMVD